MDYNPYAPPQAPYVPPEPPRLATGAPEPWNTGEVLSESWSVFKRHWSQLVPASLVMVLGGGWTSLLRLALVSTKTLAHDSAAYVALDVTLRLVGVVLTAFFLGGWLRVSLAAARGQTIRVGDALRGGSTFVQLLAVNLIETLLTLPDVLAQLASPTTATVVGFITLVPLAVLPFYLFLAEYLIVDQRLGAVEAMRTSVRLMDGHKRQALGFVFAGTFLLLGSAICCVAPVLAAIPTYLVAKAFIYLRMTGGGAPSSMAHASST